MLNIGAGELILILIVVLIVFGPGKLPEVAKAMGKAVREFRKASSNLQRVWDDITKESTPVANKTSYSSRIGTSASSSEEKNSKDDGVSEDSTVKQAAQTEPNQDEQAEQKEEIISEDSTAKQVEQAERNKEETQDQPVKQSTE